MCVFLIFILCQTNKNKSSKNGARVLYSSIFDIMNFCFYQVLMNDILIERFNSVEDTR